MDWARCNFLERLQIMKLVPVPGYHLLDPYLLLFYNIIILSVPLRNFFGNILLFIY